MLGNLKVGRKILAIVALVAVFLGLLLVGSFISFAQLHRSLDAVRNESVPNAMLAKDMQMQVVQVQQWLTDISATRAQDGLDDGFREAETAYRRFLDGLEKMRSTYAKANDAAGIARTEQIRQRMVVWYATGRKMAQAYIDGGAADGNRLMGEFDAVSKQLQDVLDPLIATQVDEATREVGKAVDEARKVQVVMVIGIVVAVAVLALGGLLLTRGVAAPLDRLSATMGELVARKDFSVRLEASGQDEIAAVARSFDDLVAMLHGMLREFNQDVHRLDATAADLAEAIDRSSRSSDASSASASAMAAAVEEMSVSLDQMRDNTRGAQDIVGESARHSDAGGQVIGMAVADMQKTTASVQQVAATIGQLGEQTARISSIVDVIRDVADQTNLLALNAAIEAARAGEQGRGFAVVADEVRKLAERTANATGEIAAMIAAIQDSAQTAVGRMEDVVKQSDTGARLAADAARAIDAIRSGAARAVAAFADITHAISEQSVAGQSIAAQVEQVAQAASENSGAIGNTAAVAHTLESLSGEIRRRIGQFKT